MDVTDTEHAYLREHVWGLLATGRSDGAPQMSMVAYDWDGSDIVISCRGQAAKYVNAGRNSSVVFAVPDDLDNLTVTGTAVCHDSGAVRDQLTQRLRDRLANGHVWASTMLDDAIASGLDSVDRVIIQIVPSAVSLLKPQG
jgi:PPOX class probable F420-dependent enzyme